MREPVLTEPRTAQPTGSQISVTVAAMRIGRSDLAAIRDGWFPVPSVHGREGAGIVDAVGPEVTRVRVGDRVVLSRATRDAAEASHITGRTARSFWATRLVVHQNSAVRVPDDVPLELAAALGSGVLIGYTAITRTLAPAAGDSVLILGAGAVGLAAAMTAVAGDCTVLVTDPRPARCGLARELGAAWAGHPEELGPRLAADFGPVRRVLDTVVVQSSFDEGFAALGPRGVMASVVSREARGPATVSRSTAVWGRIVTGVFEGDTCPGRDIPSLIDLWRAGRLPLESLVTVYPVTEMDVCARDWGLGEVVEAVLVVRPEEWATVTALLPSRLGHVGRSDVAAL